MQVYALGSEAAQPDLSSYRDTGDYLIVADFEEADGIRDALGIAAPAKKTQMKADDHVRFESYDNCDFVGLVLFEFREGRFSFERVDLYFGRNFLLLVAKDKGGLHGRIAGDLRVERARAAGGREELALLYYRFLNGALSRMFDALARYEETLSGVEAGILTKPDRIDFERIVKMKGTTFRIKKCMRFLLLVGDEIDDNDNDLIPAKLVKHFKKLDPKINRLYEFAAGLHEAAEHLMDLYDSAVTARTNNLINKLTIITVFATPLTVITGIYGMNFVYMPELQNRYGYFAVLGIMSLCVGVTYAMLKKLRVLK